MIQHSHQEIVTLIKNGKRAEARMLLVNHLKTNQNDAAAWWLLAKAAPSEDIARQALQEVERLNPGNARVAQALAKLGTPDADEPTTTLADLLSDAANRLLPDEPEIKFEEIDDIDIWVGNEEKQKREAFEANRIERRPSKSSRFNLSLGLVFMTLGFLFIATMINSIKLPAVVAENRCVTESGRAPFPAINHAADSSITVPNDALYQMELVAHIATVVYTNSVTEKYSFSIDGDAGDNISITLSALDAGVNPTLELYNPAGQQIAFCDDYADDNPGALLRVHLDNSASYTLVVSQTNSTATGRYSVEFEYR